MSSQAASTIVSLTVINGRKLDGAAALNETQDAPKQKFQIKERE